MMSKSLLQNTFTLTSPGVVFFADIIKIVAMFIKTVFLKTQEKLKELEIMYPNAIHILIS